MPVAADETVGTGEENAPEGLSAGEKLMTIVEHLDELRTRLIRSLVYVGIGCGIAFLICKKVLRFLEAPAGNIQFQALSLEEPVVVFFKVAFLLRLNPRLSGDSI